MDPPLKKSVKRKDDNGNGIYFGMGTFIIMLPFVVKTQRRFITCYIFTCAKPSSVDRNQMHLDKSTVRKLLS